MSKVSGSRLGIVFIVHRNGKNTCALETVVCNVGGRKVGCCYSVQRWSRHSGMGLKLIGHLRSP